MALTAYVDNDNDLLVSDLKRSSDDALLSGSSVTASVETSTGGTVSGATDISLTATTNAGEYRGTLGSTVSLNHQTDYTAKIDATSSGGIKARWEVELDARIRRQ